MKYYNLLLIGVCGGSASGKSSISKYILNFLNPNKKPKTHDYLNNT